MAAWLKRLNRTRLRWKRARRFKYQSWINRYEAPLVNLLESNYQAIDGPLISILMPVYKPDLGYLKQAIASVQSQIYENWELCICDDCSQQEDLVQYLEHIAAQDARIRFCIRQQNGHISQASNDAAAIARGEYFALLDQDDLLAKHALLMVAQEIINNPEVGLIYSDEDKIDDKGQRYIPYFKPDWNRYLLRSQNFISHLGVYSKAVFTQVGGFRVGLEGSQDYDLALRCVEQLDPSAIRHIPQILYHWRMHEKSTSASNDAKPYALVAAKRAISEHLARCGIEGSVQRHEDVGYQVTYAPISERRLVDLVVTCAYESTGAAVSTLTQLAQQTDYPVNSAFFRCQDGIYHLQFESAELKKIRSGVLNAASLHGLVADFYCSPEREDVYLCILASDSVTHASWLTGLVGVLDQKDVAVVGGRLVDAKGTLIHGGYVLEADDSFSTYVPKRLSRGMVGNMGLIREVSAVSSACLLIGAGTFCDIGGFSANMEGCLADVDLCLKAAALAGSVVWTPTASVVLREPAMQSSPTLMDLERFNSKWHKRFHAYVSPHLVNRDAYFCLDWQRSCRHNGVAFSG